MSVLYSLAVYYAECFDSSHITITLVLVILNRTILIYWSDIIEQITSQSQRILQMLRLTIKILTPHCLQVRVVINGSLLPQSQILIRQQHNILGILTQRKIIKNNPQILNRSRLMKGKKLFEIAGGKVPGGGQFIVMYFLHWYLLLFDNSLFITKFIHTYTILKRDTDRNSD